MTLYNTKLNCAVTLEAAKTASELGTRVGKAAKSANR